MPRLQDYISEYGTNNILSSLEKLEEYLCFCFYDQDFLPRNVEKSVSLYLKLPTMLSIMFPDRGL